LPLAGSLSDALNAGRVETDERQREPSPEPHLLDDVAHPFELVIEPVGQPAVRGAQARSASTIVSMPVENVASVLRTRSDSPTTSTMYPSVAGSTFVTSHSSSRAMTTEPVAAVNECAVDCSSSPGTAAMADDFGLGGSEKSCSWPGCHSPLVLRGLLRTAKPRWALVREVAGVVVVRHERQRPAGFDRLRHNVGTGLYSPG
jgi:hypothetical protein